MSGRADTVSVTASALGVETLSAARKRRELTARKSRALRNLGERPDAERVSADGYRVTLTYSRELRELTAETLADATATVRVTRYGRAVDTCEVSAAEGFAAWRHTASYAPAYAAELRERPAPLLLADDCGESDESGEVGA